MRFLTKTYRCLACAFILLINSNLLAQVSEAELNSIISVASENELVIESSRMLQENYYYFSEIIVDKLLSINPNSSNYNYRKGFIILDARMEASKALPYFLKAENDTDKNFDMYAASEKSAPLDVFYHIGRCYHLLENIDSAIIYYNRFLEKSNPKSALVEKAKLKIEQCLVAKALIKNPNKDNVVNLGKVINSEYPEYSSIISLDEHALFFTSRRPWVNGETEQFRDEFLNNYPEDIYCSTNYPLSPSNTDFITWSTPNKLSFCDEATNEGSVSVSCDERKVFVYEDLSGNGDIYVSLQNGNEYSAMRKLQGKDLNTKYWETHCTQSTDGNTLYFVSDRPEGFGGRDIYSIKKLANGNWDKPKNLGATVNTPYDEDSPFIGVDGKTLYFASNCSKSMGEFDIFVAHLNENSVWSDVENLGFPINSTGDDVFYTTTADGLIGYLSSHRNGGYGDKDIYRIENAKSKLNKAAVLFALIKSNDGSKIPESAGAKITCIDCENKNESLLQPRVRDGYLFNSLEPCHEYKISFYIDPTEKEFYSENFKTDCNKTFQKIYKEVIIKKNRLVPQKNYVHICEVYDKSSGKILDEVELIFINKDAVTINGRYVTDFANDLIYGDTLQYVVKVNKSGYLTQEFSYFEQLLASDTVIAKFLLEPSVIGLDLTKTLNLNPIYFDLNKFEIRSDAKIELDKIVKIMNDNPSLVVELGSHTDCRGTKEYNIGLSDNRAKASAAYIKQRITNPDRIYGKGYGESVLLNNCPCEGKTKSTCSEIEHQLNRRTEFKIISNNP